MRFRRLANLVPLTLLVGGAFLGGAWAASTPAAPTAAPPKKFAPAEDKSALKTFKVRQASSEADLAGAAQVTIENKFGHVHVRAGGPRVKVEETIFALGKNQADATARAKGFKVTTKRDPKEGLKITVEGDAKNVDVGFNLVVSMPPTTKVKVRVSDGDARVDDFTADVIVDGSSGAASIGKVKGKVGASTAGGNISIAGALGGAEAQTSSGSIDLAGANGKVTARTMSGAIKAQIGKSDKIIASTMSGAINVTVSSPFSGELHASSSSGDIHIAIPVNSDCKVTTATGTGATKCTLPLKDVKRNGPNYDAGHLGAGKGAVRVTNDSGAIIIVPTK